ncbi:MAG: PAS domain-containing sensor histidine kinase, partial [Caldimonas sp.]
MQASRLPSTSKATRTWPERLFGRWWRRQSAARQDRFATLGPLISVLLFLAAIISAFWYLRNEEFEREQESVKRDTEVSQQAVRLRLIENHEQLVRMAREIATGTIDRKGFLLQASTFTRERPEITNLIWVGANRLPVAGYSATSFPPETGISGNDTPASLPVKGSGGAPDIAFTGARDLRQTVYSPPFADSFGNPVFQAQIPLLDRSTFAGTLIAEYSIERLVRYYIPAEVSKRHTIVLLDAQNRTLASTLMTVPGQASKRPSILYEAPVAPANNGLVLRGQGHRTSIGLISNTLFWMVVALSILTVWML